MCGAIEKAGVNSVLEGDLLENKRSHIRSMETPVETSLRSELDVVSQSAHVSNRRVM